MAAAKAAPHRTSIGARRNPQTEAAVLQAARNLLIEKGYAGFSIDEVARRAGAGKPTIYRWWPTKADLFIAVYTADKDAAFVVPDTGNLRRDLVAYTSALWSFWRNSPSGRAFRALIAEAQGSEAALAALKEKFLATRLAPLRRLFEQAAARGDIPAAGIAARLALYVGFNWYRLLTGELDEDAGLIAAVAAVIGTDKG
ncbi:MAG TPA: TetR/AcrR family transcriptional regulator [Ferrovibrio sp.]|uniref:TetR/AcrR family transcriptional regulator n=1 Tax=Ferrovibrio sp. TaxID=1917215 RepID=UPI002ED4173D